MVSFLRRGAAALCALMILTASWISAGARADVAWPENTAGQQRLKAYLETANRFLVEMGEPGLNSLFEAYPGLVIFGITDLPGAEVPEGVEITARLFAASINSLEVRVSDFSRFPRIAAAFLQALSPEEISREEALKVPTERMQKAAKAPGDSFEDPVEELNGTVPYVYYAYYPDQYHDGVNWLQMTVIFPLEGSWDGEEILTGEEETRAPDTWSGLPEEYEGYDPEDDYVHYEVFVSPTPEPDSAAAEEWK